MFWWGLMCGVFVGSWLGLLIACLCVASDRKYDPPEADELKQV
jgi:ABC-type uncharacterized transport system permease subunit